MRSFVSAQRLQPPSLARPDRATRTWPHVPPIRFDFSKFRPPIGFKRSLSLCACRSSTHTDGERARKTDGAQSDLYQLGWRATLPSSAFAINQASFLCAAFLSAWLAALITAHPPH